MLSLYMIMFFRLSASKEPGHFLVPDSHTLEGRIVRDVTLKAGGRLSVQFSLFVSSYNAAETDTDKNPSFDINLVDKDDNHIALMDIRTLMNSGKVTEGKWSEHIILYVPIEEGDEGKFSLEISLRDGQLGGKIAVDDIIVRLN